MLAWLLAAWTLMLGLVTLVLWRDVSIVEARLRTGGAAANGLEVGSVVPRFVRRVAPRVIVFLADSCDVCFDVAADIARMPDADDLIVAIAPRDGDGDALEALLPGVRTLRGAEAERWVQALDVHVSPFALALERDMVVSKGHIRDRRDIRTIVGPAIALWHS